MNASTRRGDDRIDGPNWFMAMFSHPIGENAQLGFRGMVSLDLLTERGSGYPLLFQTGETWNGESLHDRQHPHDLFDELSVSYSQKFGRDFSAYLYLAYPGEPALGPPTFMHRLSAMDNPDAPLSHHWQDSTHVTFGVVTLGAVWRDLKIEGSTFKGREPDEVRYDFDEPIRSAAVSRGTRREIWRCRFRTATSGARKNWSRIRTVTAPRRRSSIIYRSVGTRTGRTR